MKNDVKVCFVIWLVALVVLMVGGYWIGREVDRGLYRTDGVVDATAFCVGGLTPEPSFCPRNTSQALRIGQDTFVSGEETDIQPAAGYRVLNN